MTDILSGGLGLALLVAAALLAALLDVRDEVRSPEETGGGKAVAHGKRRLTAARIVLVALVAVGLLATYVRIFVVLR